MSEFLKSFDTLFNDFLTDWQNQFPEADISKGSLVYIKCACQASAVWGLYKFQDWISRQIFPDSADTQNLEHHAWVRGLSRKSGESDAELLERLLGYIRMPPAGGNRYDYEKWAEEINGVKAAYCIPLAQGLGTVDVILMASGANEIPDQALLDEVKAYIDDVRPVTAATLRVLAPSIVTQDVTMQVTGDDLNLAIIQSDIEAMMTVLKPGEGLTLSQLSAIGVNNEAADVTITVPAANVTAESNEIIRPGVIDVSEP
jgi:uncharacterized phage protein gp47/JayE